MESALQVSVCLDLAGLMAYGTYGFFMILSNKLEWSVLHGADCAVRRVVLCTSSGW